MGWCRMSRIELGLIACKLSVLSSCYCSSPPKDFSPSCQWEKLWSHSWGFHVPAHQWSLWRQNYKLLLCPLHSWAQVEATWKRKDTPACLAVYSMYTILLAHKMMNSLKLVKEMISGCDYNDDDKLHFIDEETGAGMLKLRLNNLPKFTATQR